ncbi:outer membrane protein assembly factor BamB family protein [Mycobacterium sp. NPDC003449]
MGREETAERVQGVLHRLTLVLAGVAVGLLACAVALAWWSRLGAAQPLGADSWFAGVLHRWGADLPGRIPLAVTVVAVLLVAAMALAWLRGRDEKDLPAIPVVIVALVALVFFAFFTQGIPAFYRAIAGSYPVTPSLPAGVGAWGLCLAGAVAALLSAGAFARLAREDARPLALGAVIALVAGVAVTVVAARAGDDDRFVDAATAAATDVPAAPSALGRRAFTNTVAGVFDEPGPGGAGLPHYQIAAAGTGFVVLRDQRVTAYGADGDERWHYARTGQADVTVDGIRVVDDGATVLVSAGRAVVGLDAVTGEHLWTSADADLVEAVRGRYGPASGPLLMRWDETLRWSRYDARTGRPMWTVDAPHPDCGMAEPVATPSGVVSVVPCADGKVWLTLLDPQTGETSWDTSIFAGRAAGADTTDPAAGLGPQVLAAPANRVGVFVDIEQPGAEQGSLYVNLATRTVSPLPPGGYPAPAPGPGDEFVVSDRQLTVFGADGGQRCTLGADLRAQDNRVPGLGGGVAYLSFPDAVVVAARGAQAGLLTFDAATCAPTGRVPAEGIEGVVPVPGAVLVLRRDGRDLVVDGYRPA